MWIVFKLLISNIHSDSFSIYIYVQSCVLIKYLEWRCCEIELSKCTSLWDLRTRRSNWAARLGASWGSVERHLLPTQILQTPRTELSATTTDRQEKTMEGHVVGTGVGPLSLQANDLVRLAWDGHRWWIRDWAKGGCTSHPPFTVRSICPIHSTGACDNSSRSSWTEMSLYR